MVREKWVQNFQDCHRHVNIVVHGTGFNLAILQVLGQKPEEIEIFHISAIAFARMFAPSFKIFLKYYPFLLLLRCQ